LKLSIVYFNHIL